MRGLGAERLTMALLSAARSRADVFPPAPAGGQITSSPWGQTAPILLSFSSFTSRHRPDLDTLRAKIFHGFPLPTETACLGNSECRSGFVFVFLTPKEFVI